MKKQLHLSFIFMLLCFAFQTPLLAQSGGVGVNSTGAMPDASAVLDVSSITKGTLMPRMTAAQRDAIANPAMGLTIFNTDCGVYNYNAGSPSSPNWVTINSSNSVIAAVSVSANPVGAICSGTSVTFTATPASGINSPNYQWQVNGADVGTNSSSYTNDALNNGDVVNCILTTNENCVTGSPATSNSITMTVNPVPSTPGSISGPTSACGGSAGNVYSITPVAGATSYNWSVPGDAAITAGSGNSSITVTFGSDSGNISVAAVNSCGTSSQVNYPVSVIAIPATPGNISGSSSVCANSTGNVYSISAVSGATTYSWSVPSGASVTGGGGTTSVTVSFGSSSGNISVTAGNTCGTSSASSLSVTLTGGGGTQTYNYSGNQQTFTVPACVYSVSITAYGAQGATGGNTGNPSLAKAGGLGGQATGTLSVTPGESLYVFVGGQNGYNGGGVGGNGSGGSYGVGGVGGGASDIRVGGTDYGSRVIVAGGGGGGGGQEGSYYSGAGGTGGGTTGGMGDQSQGNPTYCPGASGGTQGAGGAGSCWNGGSGVCGTSGSLGQGGTGANWNSYTGGGGGGGYYGGGGASNWAGGAGGGGGSGYVGGVTNSSMQNGVQSGNGQIIITW